MMTVYAYHSIKILPRMDSFNDLKQKMCVTSQALIYVFLYIIIYTTYSFLEKAMLVNLIRDNPQPYPMP